MDLSKLSEADLQAVANGDMASVSDEGLAHLSGQAPEEELGQKAMKLGLEGLDYVGRGLDYAGGLVRGAAGKAAGAALGKDLGVKAEDVLKGKAPSSAELMERAGVPKGLSASDIPAIQALYSETGKGLPLQKGGMFDPSVRGAAGLGADIASDPLTYLSLGASALGKGAVKLALNPVKEGLKAAGKKTYTSAFKNIDSKLAKEGIDPLSKYFLQEGAPVVSKGGVLKRIPEMQKKAGSARDTLYALMNDKGATISREDLIPTVLEALGKVERRPTGASKEAAEQLAVWAESHLPTEPVNATMASELKTAVGKAKPNAANFAAEGDLPAIKRSVYHSYKTGLENAASRVSPELGDKLKGLNKEFQTYGQALEPAAQDLAVAERKMFPTQVDAMALAAKPAAAVAKNIVRAANTTLARTAAGKALLKGGEIPEGVWRRILLNATEKEENK